MSHQIHDEFSRAVTAAMGGEASVIPVGRTVVCDCCNADMTDDPRTGGFAFTGFGGTWAAGPCCAAREEARMRETGNPVTGRRPAGMPFADWVRGMRGPEAAIRVTPGLLGGAS